MVSIKKWWKQLKCAHEDYPYSNLSWEFANTGLMEIIYLVECQNCLKRRIFKIDIFYRMGILDRGLEGRELDIKIEQALREEQRLDAGDLPRKIEKVRYVQKNR